MINGFMKKAAWLTGSRRICGGGVLCGASLASMILVVASVLGGCHEIEDYENSPKGVFEQLWGVLDEHYCFFKQKDVDWNEIHSRYGAMVSDRMTDEEPTCSTSCVTDM